ncbi:DUF2381 family protein [Corallococcus sicarius]|uniref:DUF2381 family protein n=1 Tax=Corallococcus sicarius TaxID=2316726 RepID=A0A3A8NVR2_9BACT|nr:DUF2381 family protein [Corallococcus sicarius]RKH46301.1 DUF2381 family protein [Corallococcus sicarius]
MTLFPRPSLKVALLVAHAFASVAAAQVTGAPDEEGAGRIEWSADREQPPQELRISPGLATLLLSDSPVARWELSGRENFRRVMEGTDTLALLPRHDLKEGTRLKLTLVFADGEAPLRAELVLVVHPVSGQRQAELYRHRRGVESYQEEVRQLRAEVGRARAEVERLRTTQARPDGLTGLLLSGVMGLEGVSSRDLLRDPQSTPGLVFSVTRVRTFRASTRAAVQAELDNQGEVPWRFKGAALVDGSGHTVHALVVWPQEPIAPKESAMGIMEFELPSSTARGPYTLKLWAEGAAQAVTVRDIFFP